MFKKILESTKMNKFLIKASAAAVILALNVSSAYAVEDAAFWLNDGAIEILKSKRLVPNAKRAKNIILFIGDGMGVSTVTGARIFEGQKNGVDGERNMLGFENFPYVALSKTYSANQQTSDSAPTMTAMVAGVKTNDGVLSLAQAVNRSETNLAVLNASKVQTILEKAELLGKSTGVISTARITHATPAATYAHISNRDWEGYANLSTAAKTAGVKDIAAQMIDNFGTGGIGDGLEVVLGGGRTYFLPNTAFDPEYTTTAGRRTDSRNLVNEFQSKFAANYVYDKAGFDAIDPATTTRLLGLFEPSHMKYEQDRATDTAGEPSIAEMTSKAIDILKKNTNGYFLMVEAGRIDHASHAGNAYRTFSDTVALSDAVKAALGKVNLADTLIIVSADHSHTLNIAGYPKRGNPILGKVISPGATSPDLALDGKPYTTVAFLNGKGYAENVAGDDIYAVGAPNQATYYNTGRVADMSLVNTEHPNFHQEALVPTSAETHSGEDVAIYAAGPKAYLMHGVQEQSYIFQVMKDAFGY